MGRRFSKGKHLKGDANSLLKSVQYSGKGLLEMQL